MASTSVPQVGQRVFVKLRSFYPQAKITVEMAKTMFPKIVWTVVEGVVISVDTMKKKFNISFPAMFKVQKNLAYSYLMLSKVFLTMPQHYEKLTLKQYTRATGAHNRRIYVEQFYIYEPPTIFDSKGVQNILSICLCVCRRHSLW